MLASPRRDREHAVEGLLRVLETLRLQGLDALAIFGRRIVVRSAHARRAAAAEPPEPPPGLATSAVPPASKAAVSSVETRSPAHRRAPLRRDGSDHITAGPRRPKQNAPAAAAGAFDAFRLPEAGSAAAAAAADDVALDVAAEQGADRGAEHGAGGAAAAAGDLAAGEGARRAADDEAGGAVGLAAIDAAVGAAPGLAVIGRRLARRPGRSAPRAPARSGWRRKGQGRGYALETLLVRLRRV